MAEPLLYLGGVSLLLLEADALETSIVAQVLAGFGLKRVAQCAGTAAAAAQLRGAVPDMLVVGMARSGPGEVDSYAFIRHLRRSGTAAARVPIILLAGHTSAVNVLRARDCGASAVIAKPVAPAMLFDRLSWLVTDTRDFVVAEGYAGPNRRFQSLGPPPGLAGRRRDDPAPDVWERQHETAPRPAAEMPDHTKRLARLVLKPGGVSAAAAVAAAESNLVAICGGALEHIDATLDRMQALAWQEPTAERWAELYRLGNTVVGTAGAFGLGDLGALAFRLCTLLDRQPPAAQCRTAVQLHLDSLRLLRSGGLDAGQAHAIETALSRVVERLPG